MRRKSFYVIWGAIIPSLALVVCLFFLREGEPLQAMQYSSVETVTGFDKRRFQNTDLGESQLSRHRIQEPVKSSPHNRMSDKPSEKFVLNCEDVGFINEASIAKAEDFYSVVFPKGGISNIEKYQAMSDGELQAAIDQNDYGAMEVLAGRYTFRGIEVRHEAEALLIKSAVRGSIDALYGLFTLERKHYGIAKYEGRFEDARNHAIRGLAWTIVLSRHTSLDGWNPAPAFSKDIKKDAEKHNVDQYLGDIDREAELLSRQLNSNLEEKRIAAGVERNFVSELPSVTSGIIELSSKNENFNIDEEQFSLELFTTVEECGLVDNPWKHLM